MPGRDAVAILSYDFWRTRFAEDPRVVGTTVRINGTAFTVIGIAPEHFHGIVAGLEPNAVWIPTAMYGAASPYCDAPLSRTCGGVGVIGQLAGASSIDQAYAEVAGLMRQLEAVYPRNSGDGAPWFARFAASGFKSRTRTLQLSGCSPRRPDWCC